MISRRWEVDWCGFFRHLSKDAPATHGMTPVGVIRMILRNEGY